LDVAPAAATPLTTAAPSEAAQTRRDRDAEKVQQAKRAVETLRKLETNRKEDRKALARQKLERVKAQLEQLKMLGATPKRIAALARQLAEAVKEYAAAGGKGAGPPVLTSPAPQAQAPADAAEAGTDGADAAEAEAKAKPAEADVADPQKAAPANPYAQTQAAEAEDRNSRRRSEASGDKDFLDQARGLARKLRELAQAAIRRMGHVKEADEAEEATKQAMDEIHRAEQSLNPSAGLMVLA